MAAETEEFEASSGKSLGELGREALWFSLHTIFAVLALVVVLATGLAMKISSQPIEPKLIGTVLAFVFPMAVGFIIVKRQQNDVAKYVWISGLLFFSIVCVTVLDLPTGPGQCEHCGAVDKLLRTFFEITNGSGLMGGDGLMLGSWIPLALFGYAMGASFAYKEPELAERAE